MKIKEFLVDSVIETTVKLVEISLVSNIDSIDGPFFINGIKCIQCKQLQSNIKSKHS